MPRQKVRPEGQEDSERWPYLNGIWGRTQWRRQTFVALQDTYPSSNCSYICTLQHKAILFPAASPWRNVCIAVMIGQTHHDPHGLARGLLC